MTGKQCSITKKLNSTEPGKIKVASGEKRRVRPVKLARIKSR